MLKHFSTSYISILRNYMDSISSMAAAVDKLVDNDNNYSSIAGLKPLYININDFNAKALYNINRYIPLHPSYQFKTYNSIGIDGKAVKSDLLIAISSTSQKHISIGSDRVPSYKLIEEYGHPFKPLIHPSFRNLAPIMVIDSDSSSSYSRLFGESTTFNDKYGLNNEDFYNKLSYEEQLILGNNMLSKVLHLSTVLDNFTLISDNKQSIITNDKFFSILREKFNAIKLLEKSQFIEYNSILCDQFEIIDNINSTLDPIEKVSIMEQVTNLTYDINSKGISCISSIDMFDIDL